MSQIEKTVSREQGLRLRSFGFDVPVHTYQVDADNGAIIITDRFNHNFNPQRVSLPTYSEVCNWLAESKDVDVVIYPVFTDEGREYTFKIYTPEHQEGIEYSDFFTDREDASESAIMEALNLI